MFNYRFIDKFLLIALTIIVMQTKVCSAGCASDGGGEIPPPKIPDTSAQQMLHKAMKSAEKEPLKKADKPLPSPGISDEAEKAEVKKPEKKPEPEVEKQKADKKKAKPEKEFLSYVGGMLSILLKTILLIFIIFGGILLYRHLKGRRLFAFPKHEKKENGEPQTVSEAVSSYIKHKLKR